MTLTSPNIGPTEWTDSQHTHASPATAGSTLGPGTTLSSPAFAGVVSTGAQFSGNLGVGVAPAAWGAAQKSVQASNAAFMGSTAGATLVYNAYYDGTGWRSLAADASFKLDLIGTGAYLGAAPSVAAGAAQTFTTRLQVAQTGTVTLTPNAGQNALAANSTAGGLVTLGAGLVGGSAMRLASAGHLEFDAATGYVVPSTDNTKNNGGAGNRWIAVYAVNGTIQTSLAEAKQDITPLDPAAALDAVRATTPVTFDYKPPERGPEWYELPDDPEQAYARLLQRMQAAPLEEGARHQRGFVLQDDTGQFPCDPMFETGDGQSNAANTAGILLAAIKALDARLSALEAP